MAHLGRGRTERWCKYVYMPGFILDFNNLAVLKSQHNFTDQLLSGYSPLFQYSVSWWTSGPVAANSHPNLMRMYCMTWLATFIKSVFGPDDYGQMKRACWICASPCASNTPIISQSPFPVSRIACRVSRVLSRALPTKATCSPQIYHNLYFLQCTMAFLAET
jgi:hypothetical protein